MRAASRTVVQENTVLFVSQNHVSYAGRTRVSCPIDTISMSETRVVHKKIEFVKHARRRVSLLQLRVAW